MKNFGCYLMKITEIHIIMFFLDVIVTHDLMFVLSS